MRENHFKNENMQELYTYSKQDPELIAERIGWLLDGNYGFDEMEQAENVLRRPRMNQRAILYQMIAYHEFYQVSQAQANRVYNALTKTEQARLNEFIQMVVDKHKAELLERY